MTLPDTLPAEPVTPVPGELSSMVDPSLAISPEDQKNHDELFSFKDAKTFLTQLRDGFDTEVALAKANRDRRSVDINVEAERKAGTIKPSDTLVPMRVIDENISREKPAFIAYLQNSRRLAIFSDRLQPQVKHDELEGAFTRGMQYNDWIIPYHKTIDGAQLHGWDWFEVLYDADKPLHCGVEHVGHDRLEFSLDAEDIQNNIRVARVYKWTRTQIDTAVKKFGFSPEQANKLKNYQSQNSNQSNSTKDIVYTVRKGYFKYEGVVYVCWYSLDACDDWLLAPAKFFNGVCEQVEVQVPQPPMQAPMFDAMGQVVGVEDIPQPPRIELQWQDVDEVLYPLCLLPFEETEQKEISTRKGRAFKDKYKQEVMTTGWSSFLNGHNRATWVMGSRTQESGKNEAEVQSVEIKDGAILSQPINWNRMPYPDPGMLQALQLFDQKIAQGIGQMTYAVQSKSSGARTTAKEIESAQQDTALLSSVNITLFSACIRKVMTAAWRIVQSQSLQNKIKFYGTYQSVPLPDGTSSEPEFVNDEQAISVEYDIRPAGDTDVIQRQEQISSMMEFWGVVSGTPIAGPFLGELLKLKFGEKGEVWAKMLESGDPRALLAQYAQIVSALLANPAEAMQIGPKEQQALQMLLQQTQQLITPPAPGNTNGQSQQPNSPSAQQSGGTSNQRPTPNSVPPAGNDAGGTGTA